MARRRRRTGAARNRVRHRDQRAEPGPEVLKAAAKPSLGRVLADDSGRTVYMFAKDEADQSYCQGACASVWVPVTTKGMPMAAVSSGARPV